MVESGLNLLLDLLGCVIRERNQQRVELLASYPFVLSSQPDENSLDFSSCMLRPGIKNAQELACGVCLLNVDSRSRVSHLPSPVPCTVCFPD